MVASARHPDVPDYPDDPSGVGSARAEQVAVTKQFFLRYVANLGPTGFYTNEKTLLNHGDPCRPLKRWVVNLYGFEIDRFTLAADPFALSQGQILAAGRRVCPLQARIRWQDGSLGNEYRVDIGAGVTLELPPARSLDVSVFGPADQAGTFFAEVTPNGPPVQLLGAGAFQDVLVGCSLHPIPDHGPTDRDARFTVVRNMLAGPTVADVTIPAGATRVIVYPSPQSVNPAPAPIVDVRAFELGFNDPVFPSFIPILEIPVRQEVPLSGIGSTLWLENAGAPVARVACVFTLEI